MPDDNSLMMSSDVTPLKISSEEAAASTAHAAAHRRFVIIGLILFGVTLLGVIGLFIRYQELDEDPQPAPASLLMACTHPIYCTGELLQAVQLHNPPLFPDSKTFVDMPCKALPSTILAAYQATKGGQSFNLSAFIETYFDPPGAELNIVVPPDFVPRPQRLAKIQDPALREFGYNVHAVWKNLSRQFNLSYTCGPTCVSSLPLPKPFVVPGGRFREFYYWDTYWILKGLLVSNLTTTARNVLDNLLYMVSSYGFVPNGARVYFLDRSQPPLLTQMVLEYIQATNDATILNEALPLLHKEHTFWMQTPHAIEAIGTESVVLNRYYVHTDAPRPESYREDVQTLSRTGRSALDLFSNLATGAETGWDYSTRWFANHSNDIASIAAQDVIPTDLNAILLQNEIILCNWTCAGGAAPNPSMCSEYNSWASRRKRSMHTFLRAASSNVLSDFNVKTLQTSSTWYASMSAPLAVPEFVDSLSGTDLANAAASIVAHLEGGGIPASPIASGQQWDAPNAWAPLQYYAVLALENVANASNTPAIAAGAFEVVQRWIQTTYCGYQDTGLLYEKYNVSRIGVPGNGGEYVVQSGFGWTNGAILWALDRYGDRLVAPAC